MAAIESKYVFPCYLTPVLTQLSFMLLTTFQKCITGISESLPQPGIEPTTTRLQVRYVNH